MNSKIEKYPGYNDIKTKSGTTSVDIRSHNIYWHTHCTAFTGSLQLQYSLSKHGTLHQEQN